MRRFRWQFGGSLAVFVAVVALACAASAQEKHDAPKTPPKYKAHVHHKVVEFDLTKKDQRDELLKELDAGAVDELEIIAPPPAPLTIWWDVTLWTIVVFIALLLILRKTAWDPMLEGLKKREDTIRSAVEEAKHAREETKRITAQFQAEMAAKMAEIPKIMEEARRDAELLKEEMRAEATKAIQADRQRLLREVETYKDQCRQELFTHAANLATLISAKAIGRHLSEEDHRRLVDEALNDLAQR